jgi:hypothetical protein
LLLLGGKKLGRPSKKVRKALETLGDMERLHVLLNRILDATSWEELLGSVTAEPDKPSS